MSARAGSMAHSETSGAEPLGVAASIALYLGVLGGTLGLGIGAIQLGVRPSLVVPPAFLALCALFYALERWRPFTRAWWPTRADVRVDLPLLLLAGPVGVGIVTPLVVVLSGALSRMLGAGLWPTHWPLVAQAVLALFVGDFVRYWFHRAEHHWLPLWRIHATHHSAERIYFLNGPRLHPLEVALSGILQTAPLVALGAGEDALGLQLLLTLAIGRFQHCNLALSLGPLDYVFSAPEPHRWHHSRTLAEANSNYGSNLIVWDIVFGTFLLPAGRTPPADIGIAALPAFPSGYLDQLASPFRWRRVKREAAPAAA
jgi:sterol desaturase/sphingolipid hydroxylase (fatty acid hydroxylase superfamily)